jgi:hypothetical protein
LTLPQAGCAGEVGEAHAFARAGSSGDDGDGAGLESAAEQTVKVDETGG